MLSSLHDRRLDAPSMDGGEEGNLENGGSGGEGRERAKQQQVGETIES